MSEARKLPAVGSELICVSIGEHLYAIDIMQVREIRGWSTSTPLPHAPPHVLGMINLRERTELVNGLLTIDSATGRGTRIQVYIPLTEEAADRLHHPVR